jgi:hypothetical protein
LGKLQQYYFDAQFKIVVISGLGGTGKTKLARRYATSKKHSTNLIWLRGEDKPSLVNSVNNLACTLQEPTVGDNCTPHQFKHMLTTICSKITNGRPLLFVLDKVGSEHEFISLVLDFVSKTQNVFIIVTSVLRDLTSNRDNAKLMQLSGFSYEDAVTFITQRIGDSDIQLVQKLCTTLHCSPLVMNQAVQYIVDQRNLSLMGMTYGIQDFLNDYHDPLNALEILAYELEGNESTIITTVNESLERIRALEDGGGAVTLLHMLSYLDPNGVPVPFLERLILTIESKVPSRTIEGTIESKVPSRTIESTIKSLRSRIKCLKCYSFVSVEKLKITMNSVVQKIIPIIELDEAEILLERVAFGSFKSLSQSIVSLYLHGGLLQVISVWDHIKKVDTVMRKFEIRQVEAVDKCLQQNLPFFSSLAFIREVFESVADALDNKPNPLNPNRLLASYFIRQLKDLIKVELDQKQLPTYIKNYGENHSFTLFRKSNIIKRQVRFKINKNYAEELSALIAKKTKSRWNDDWYVLRMKYNLLKCLYEDGKHLPALALTKDVRQSFNLPDLMQFKITTLEVVCYNALGEGARASELLEELRKELEVLGSNHPIHLNYHPSEDLNTKSGSERCLVNETFPDICQLLNELKGKVDKGSNSIEQGSYVAIAEQQNGIVRRLSWQMRPQFEHKTRIPSAQKTFDATEDYFEAFFTHKPNFLIAKQILGEIKKTLFL